MGNTWSIFGDANAAGGDIAPRAKGPSSHVIAWLATVSASVVAGLVLWTLTHDSTPSGPIGGKTLEVSNKIAIGSHHMSEDTALRLFTSPSVCRSQDCVASKTSFYTGDRLA